MKAKVIFFDRKHGEGIAKLLSGGGTFMIYASGIPGKRTWYAHTACVYYSEGDIIEIEPSDFGVICKTPGKLDLDKWASLDQERLAFVCDESGNAITGLFSSNKKESGAL